MKTRPLPIQNGIVDDPATRISRPAPRRWRLGIVPVAIATAVVLAAGPATAAKRMTSFNPATHGFNFDNTFNNDVVKELDIRTGGLCGGMVYTALDYYYASGRTIPRQDFRPANRTPLQSYIYGRQVDSLKPNLTKWAEIGFNPGGARNAEFFRWGLTSELQNLKAMIDRGRPAPLGLKGHNRGDHQVLAIGYQTGARDSDLRIFIYDPNDRNRVLTMRPDLRAHLFYYEGKADSRGRLTHTWRTWFVDKSYRAKTPLSIPTPRHRNDGWVRELVFQFDTGDDDLRGGNDNVSVKILLKDGSSVVHRNLNRSARWLSNYTEFAQVKLARPIAKASILGFEFTTSFRGGFNGDNWDARRICVWSNLGSSRQKLTERSSFFRFTGDRRSMRVDMPGVSRNGPIDPAHTRGKITHVLVELTTGGDDLRGNNDNLDITVLYRSGRTQLIRTVNARKRWSDNTSHTVRLALNKPVDRADIVGLLLATTARGGIGGDNWNLDRIAVAPEKDGHRQRDYMARAGRPLKRFTGDSPRFAIRW